MKAIVFGGAGFVGSHVADALSDAGHEVSIFDLRKSGYLRSDQKMLTGDILDYQDVLNAVKGQELVFNFAGLADLDQAGTEPLDTVQLNILGTTHVLKACVEHSIKRFVYASTIYVYSDKGGFYRCSKQAAETYIEEFQRKYGLEYTILRYGTLYGPRSDSRNSIFNYLTQALRDGKISTKGCGDERREYIYVRDAARLTLDILGEDYANTRVTLTGHQSIYFKDLMNMIREILDNKVEIEFTGKTNGAHYSQTPYSYVPKSGLKLTLNPFTDLGQGLIECLEEIDGDR